MRRNPITYKYRVMRQVMKAHPAFAGFKEPLYGVYEVCCENGVPHDWLPWQIAPNELTLRELRARLTRMTKALDLPVLDHATGKPIATRHRKKT